MTENPLSSRLKRYAKVATAVSGLASKVVGERYLGLTIDRERHAADLKSLLGNLKGPVMKVAQFLATVPEAIPDEYAQEFLELQTQAPPMGAGFVRRRMMGELGPQWRSHFLEFDETPFAAASLGQVHRAKTLSGEDIACKLQYPDMTAAIEADIKQLSWLLGTYETFNKALQTSEIQEEIALRLREELDYHHEARNTKIYAHIFENTPHIRIPKTYSDLSTHRLLTMDYLPGTSVLNFAHHDQNIRHKLGQILFHAWYYPLYHYGLIHGDPHPGNYTYDDKEHLNLFDFGCIRIFQPTFIQGVIHLYEALKHDNPKAMVEAYNLWGFENLTPDIIDIMSHWARLLYEPLLDDRVRPIQASSDHPKGWEIASKVHDALHKAGGLKPPREFVFMDRAAVGIGSVLMRLGAQANWHRIFESLIHDFSPEKIQEKQNLVLSK